MLSDYIAHIIRALDRAQVLPANQIRKITGLDVCTYDQIIQGSDGRNITIEHADRMVDFFGMGMFQASFVKESFLPSNSQYKTWEGLEQDEQTLINIAGAFTLNPKTSITTLNYTKECSYFLDTCDNLVSILKDTGASDDDGTESENK